jgi:hypothetical protein
MAGGASKNRAGDEQEQRATNGLGWVKKKEGI